MKKYGYPRRVAETSRTLDLLEWRASEEPKGQSSAEVDGFILKTKPEKKGGAGKKDKGALTRVRGAAQRSRSLISLQERM
eukprot:5973383-Pleurochrysis_carterae.AAC.1